MTVLRWVVNIQWCFYYFNRYELLPMNLSMRSYWKVLGPTFFKKIWLLFCHCSWILLKLSIFCLERNLKGRTFLNHLEVITATSAEKLFHWANIRIYFGRVKETLVTLYCTVERIYRRACMFHNSRSLPY